MSGFRRIAHVDMDAFYASVEQRDDPFLTRRPVAVGGRSRGVVLSASYEARVYGVRSAMPVAKAIRLCPDLVRVPPRFDAYHEASERLHAALAAFATRIDRVGLDEAYLDLSHHPPPAAAVGEAIRRSVFRATGLTCSVGISSSKFVAKVASDHDKPDGLTIVHPARVAVFLAALPVERFHGVGPATAARLRALGYRTGADLQSTPAHELERELGRTGGWLGRMAFGRDDRDVGRERRRKSIGAERTFFSPLTTIGDISAAVAELAAKVAGRLGRHRLVARVVSVKARSPAFATVSRQRALPAPVWTSAELTDIALALLLEPDPLFPAFRLLGISCSGLSPGDGLAVARQLRLPFKTRGHDMQEPPEPRSTG